MLASSGVVFLDGQLRAPDQAMVSVFDRGFLYGDSVFETLRSYGGRVFALKEHLARLRESARLVGIAVPLGAAEFQREVEQAVTQAGFEESYVRVMLTRGQGARLGLDPAPATQPLRVILVLPLQALPEQKYSRGISAVTFRMQRVAEGTPAAGAKLGNYLVSVLATEAATRAGADEALLVDGEGRINEGASSNVFAVKDNELVTPPTSLGILAGVTRERVLRIARQLAIPTTERAIHHEELSSFSELFVTSSIRELVPVVNLDSHPVGPGSPGVLSRRLLEAFRKRVRGECAPDRSPFA